MGLFFLTRFARIFITRLLSLVWWGLLRARTTLELLKLGLKCSNAFFLFVGLHGLVLLAIGRGRLDRCLKLVVIIFIVRFWIWSTLASWKLRFDELIKLVCNVIRNFVNVKLELIVLNILSKCEYCFHKVRRRNCEIGSRLTRKCGTPLRMI